MFMGVFLPRTECVLVYYKPAFQEVTTGPKDVHLANCVSKPELLWEEIFLFIIIVLNMAVFSSGDSSVLCSSAEHLRTAEA